MYKFRDKPLREKLMAAMVGTSGLAIAMISVIFITYQWINSRDSMLQNLDAVMKIIADNSTAALSFYDADAAAQTLSALRAKPEIQFACIYTGQGPDSLSLFATYQKQNANKKCPARPLENQFSPFASLVSRSHEIHIGQEPIGVIYIERNLSDFWKSILGYLLVVILGLLGALFLALGIAALLQRFIAQPILGLARTANQVSESKDYSIRAPRGNNDEVGRLIGGFNEMLEQIGLRDQELREARAESEERLLETKRANSELQKTLARLRQTQEQLVQVEKMASLGGLVAGIAHEINTPVGVGVTAASTLRANTDTLKQEYDAKELTDSGLRRYVDIAQQSSEIILSNLNRASELIQSFKQVAVDQTSSERRRFRVLPYLNEIFLSLRPKLKKTRLKVEVQCNELLEMNSYPGALAQIITNLVMNSIIHAYEPDQEGTLRIAVEQKGDKVHLEYSDDGKGMPPDHVSRVFDPFFTTRRGSGGSGLGMHIVFNLVTQQMGGKIKLHSEPGKGTHVEVLIPAHQESQHEQPALASQRRH